ncbi:DNA polymerase I [candidate division WOR-3 bacterium]|nr:DNA polymerase I [candidate division WOR-3 bacterium]
MGKLLLLIDGYSLAYRSYYAFINNPLITSKGKPTSAAFGFARSLKKVLEKLQPDYSAVCLDHPEPTFRKKKYADYKAHRKKMPEDLKEQIPYIIEICEAAGFSVLIQPGYEADDIIATITEEAQTQGIEIVIFTLDKDLMQLAKTGVTILNMRTEGEEWINREKVEEKFGIPPERLLDYLSITGDSSDNIPGIKGIGKKTAGKLLEEFGSLEGIFSNLDNIKSSAIRKKLEGKKDEALRWKDLIELKKDVPLEKDINDLKYIGIDRDHLERVLNQLEFFSLSNDWVKKDKDPIDYSIVERLNIEKEEVLTFLPFEENVAISNGKELMVVSKKEAVSILQKTEGILLVVEDAKEFAHLTECYPKGDILNLAVMHYLLFPNRKNHTLDRILVELGLLPKNKEAKAVLMHKVAETLTNNLRTNDLWHLYKNIEEPLTSVLFKMEKHGILFDIHLLKELCVSIESEIEEIEKRIYKIAGEQFNIRSPKQLGGILFEKMKLPVIKSTKTGYSTDVEVLTELQDKNPIIQDILNFRELDKLKSSYIDSLITSINKETNRIHPTYQQTTAATGRLTATNPNIQTLPIRTERGRRIRETVIAPPEHLILSCDYSQIELRILAHISQDECLIQNFEKGEDIHTTTAARIFGIEPDMVTPFLRRKAKAINFGIIYGISPYGLSKQLKISREEAEKIIETYYYTHHGVEKWQTTTVEQAIVSGWVNTTYGRKRWIPELQNPRTVEYGKRIAINSPIQGSAADIIKKAMIDIQHSIDNKRLETKMILQIHDELLFEVPEKEKETAVRLIIPIMESTPELSVPIKVDYRFGKNWDEAH